MAKKLIDPDIAEMLGLDDSSESDDDADDFDAFAAVRSRLKESPEILDTFILLGLLDESAEYRDVCIHLGLPVEDDAVDRNPDVPSEATTLRVCWADLVDSEYDDEYEKLHDCDWTSEPVLLAGGAGSPKRTKRQKQRMRKSIRQAAAKAAAVDAVAS